MFLYLSWGTLWQIFNGGRRGRQERGRRHSNSHTGRRRQGGMRQEEESHSQEEGHPEKRPRRERSDAETEAAGGEAGMSQSRYKKGHMTNIYLADSDEKAIVDFVKDHEELYDKTSEHFKDKARKKCLCERFTNSRKLSVKVCKTWFELLRICYRKLMQSKSGPAPKRYDGTSDLDKGQVRIPEVAHSTQGLSKVIRIQVPGLRR